MLEGRWGLETLEVPQSWVCQTRIVLLVHGTFAGAVAAVSGSLQRGVGGISPAAQDAQRCPADARSGRRRPVAGGPAVGLDRPSGRSGGVCSPGRAAAKCCFPIARGWRSGCRCGRIATAGRPWKNCRNCRTAGVKIRSRALITTLWARLVLGDLFLHGIGGAKYDQVTDLLIERFFGLPAPGIMVMSATLHLPIARPAAAAGSARGHRRSNCAS